MDIAGAIARWWHTYSLRNYQAHFYGHSGNGILILKICTRQNYMPVADFREISPFRPGEKPGLHYEMTNAIGLCSCGVHTICTLFICTLFICTLFILFIAHYRIIHLHIIYIIHCRFPHY
jgi:hypothetical protein